MLAPFIEEIGVCACADIAQVKSDTTRATLKIDFMLPPKPHRAEIGNPTRLNLAFQPKPG
jgi:acyl-coenzyme A thioesterase PaaI-like protein